MFTPGTVLSSAIGSTDVWDVTPSTPLFLSSSSAALSASSFTVDALNMSSTSYAIADRLRLFPDDAAVATQAPSPALMPAFENVSEHAVSSSAAVILADSLCTFTPAMAASARSLALAFTLVSEMSSRMESRVVSACFFLSSAEGDGVDGEGACDPPPSAASPASLQVADS